MLVPRAYAIGWKTRPDPARVMPSEGSFAIFSAVCPIMRSHIGSVRPMHQADARWIFLEVKERGNQGKSAGGTFPNASGFTVLQEEVSNSVVVGDRDTAHRLHADDEHRIGVTAPNAQARIVECRHS